MAKLVFDAEDLRPLVPQIVAETLAELDARLPQNGDPLAYSKAEAAELLGLRPHQLRDGRLRGERGDGLPVPHTRVTGNRVRYTRAHLLAYLAEAEACSP